MTGADNIRLEAHAIVHIKADLGLIYSSYEMPVSQAFMPSTGPP